jgi:5-aminopentanamidase
MSIVKVATIQFEPKLFHVQENCVRIAEYISSTQADIIVFPELATCGYFFINRKEVTLASLEFVSPEMNEFQRLATVFGRIVIVGFAEQFDHAYYNSAAVFHPDKQKSRVYRKTHLFYKERFVFNEGDTGFFVIHDEERDVKIGTMICYDWRFPESARSLALHGADLIVCPSNLVTHIWTSVMPTRAIENKVYLAVANRWGNEERTIHETDGTESTEVLSFNGQSSIYSYNGEILAQSLAVGDDVRIVEIEPQKTRDKSFNAYNHIFDDRRSKFYSI